jgi:23S rRNA (guanosine2251-2'-O)-methyltransferase
LKYLGPNACQEALQRGELQILRIAESAWGRAKALIEAAQAAGVTIHREPQKSLDRRAQGMCHQGIIGEGAGINFSEMPDLIEKLRMRGAKALVLLLDGITDPNNFGAILRSAAGANVDGVIFQERRSAQINETVVRSSAGTAGRVPLVRVVNLGRAIDELKNAGLWVFGMSSSDAGTQDYLTEKFDHASAVVFGSEGKGLHKKIEERCDAMLRIRLPGEIDSLNVSVAAGILLFRIIALRGDTCESL